MNAMAGFWYFLCYLNSHTYIPIVHPMADQQPDLEKTFCTAEPTVLYLGVTVTCSNLKLPSMNKTINGCHFFSLGHPTANWNPETSNVSSLICNLLIIFVCLISCFPSTPAVTKLAIFSTPGNGTNCRGCNIDTPNLQDRSVRLRRTTRNVGWSL